jgi:hypothetical protein
MIRAGTVGRFAIPVVATVLAACDGGRAVAPSPVGSDVALGVAAFQVFTGDTAGGPLRFPAAGAAGAQYLLVGQFATSIPDVSASVTLTGTSPAPLAALVAPAPPASPVAEPIALRFHDAIRAMDAAVAAESQGMAARGIHAAPPAPAGPVKLESRRTFKVCSNISCSTTAQVPATARFVGEHSAIFVDDSAPAGGFTAGDLQQLGQQFDTDLYPVDVNAFGNESDLDGNGVVIILFTRKVNGMVGRTDCQTSFITGFFLGADLAPATRGRYNDGEIFYGLVPDPAGTVSCAYSVPEVKALVPPTFIHEFQHMISFNQHVLMRGGSTEILWLNEGLSHLAEELGGWHFDSLGTPAGDTMASRFLFGDLYNANLYLTRPGPNPMVTVTVPGALEARGAEWLFLRYLVDRFGPATTRSLVQTALLGDANVVNATRTAFATLLGRWAVALYVSDLPAFTPDSLLTYRQWRLRSTFASLHQVDPADFPRSFPLVPAAFAGGSFSAGGTVTSGSGAYVVVTQPAGGASFSVTFGVGGGKTGVAHPQVVVVRLR